MMCLLVSTKKSYLTLTSRGSLRWLTPAQRPRFPKNARAKSPAPQGRQPKIAPMVVGPNAENPVPR
jgi:hypothetical protein